MHATATFETKQWDEQPYSEVEGGPKLTRASVVNTFHGDIEGEGTLAYLTFYRPDGSGIFIGLEHVAGSLGGRSGSFVLRSSGTMEQVAPGAWSVTGHWTVVPGSGAGELQNLRGQGGFTAQHEVKQTPATLDYDFE